MEVTPGLAESNGSL